MSERFTIADVARMHQLHEIKKVGNEVYCICPFCGDRRGKFSYNIKKNVFKCWKEDKSGSPVDLHIALSFGDYSGEDGYKNAVREIFEALNGDQVLKTMHQSDLQNKVEVDEVLKSSDEHCSKVYYAMLKLCELTDSHKKKLLARGLNEEDIKRYRFKSTPKDNRGICRKLISQGYTLEGVPGFWFDESKSEWVLNLPCRGYFCPIFDGERNLLLGFQIRNDKADEPGDNKKSPKYLWLSSVGKNKGVSAGALTTFLPGENANSVIITEGILKALIIYTQLNKKVTVIGIPGINAKQGLRSYLSRFSMGYFYEAFDMDKAVRAKTEKEAKDTKRIADSAAELRNIVENEFKFPTHPLTWDSDRDGYWQGNYKGLDDFLYSYNDRDKFLSYILSKADKSLKLQKYFNSCN